MPQGRRKIPFSGKAKKAQLQQKKPSKFGLDSAAAASAAADTNAGAKPRNPSDAASAAAASSQLFLDVDTSGRSAAAAASDHQRYELKFKSETTEEMAASREQSRRPIVRMGDKSLEIGVEEFFPKELDFPTRPTWSKSMDKRTLEASEQRYFRQYVEKLFRLNESGGPGHDRSTRAEGENADAGGSDDGGGGGGSDRGLAGRLGFFELNLETWRQLWRVLEMCDVLLLVVDVRYAAAMVPPSLFDHVRRRGKDLILVLNKIDLVPPGLALAWRDFFIRRFPGIHVSFFTSCPDYNLSAGLSSASRLNFRKIRGRISMATEGAQQVLDACRSVAGAAVDLEAWRQKIVAAAEQKSEADGDGEAVMVVETEAEEEAAREHDSDAAAAQARFRDGVLTLGTIGQPNAGKSSLINSLIGQKVVSVSKTPGHTKHFQTIFITANVKLCDCPGLVFPSAVPKQLQIIMGSYPIPQVREPYSTVSFLGSRLDLPWLLSLQRREEDHGCAWSAYDVCEAFAEKRGYMTARSNRPDVYRAANHILRMTLEGKLVLALTPAGYSAAQWSADDRVDEVRNLLGVHRQRLPATIQHSVKSQQYCDKSEDRGEAFETSSEEESEGEDVAAETANKFNALAAAVE